MHNRIVGYSMMIITFLLLVLLAYYQNDVKNKNLQLCEATCGSEGESCNIETCPFKDDASSWILNLFFGGMVLILALSFYLTLLDKQKIPKEKLHIKQIDISKLVEDEKKVYDLIKEAGGSKYQSELIKETGFSKVKLTRILDKLESKQVLERKRRGMTNIVVLK